MQRCRRQRALVMFWLFACGWCATGGAAHAQLLVDEREETRVLPAGWTGQQPRIRREGGAGIQVPPARLEVLATEPEEVIEDVYFENAPFDDCDACADESCSHCRSRRAGPAGFLNKHFERMQVQQVSTSWLNRPASFGVFAGNVWADDPIDGRVSQNNGFIGGYYLGEDLTINWGWEMRLGLSALDVEYDNVPLITRTDDIILWDLNIHYYPWDNARWRPYTTIGFGLAQFDFNDELNRRVRKTTFGLPIGIGMKYLVHRGSAVRMELTDNIAFASGPMNTQHNVSLTAGLEIRFGGVRRSYWPWNPGQDYGYW